LYNVNSTQWTWISGSDTRDGSGVYGTQGKPSNITIPGARAEHSMSLDLVQNVFYIFGGYAITEGGYACTLLSYVLCIYNIFIYAARMNDLWMYNISSSQWTWLFGNSWGVINGVYGMRGVASSGNNPGSRNSHAMTINSVQNCLYISGGYGDDQSSQGTPTTIQTLIRIIFIRLFGRPMDVQYQ
jgi:hypothetical protein